MKVSNKGLLEICEHEGIVPTVYFCSAGEETYGVGHTEAAGGLNPKKMSKEMPSADKLDDAINEALEVFQQDVSKYEDRVNSAIKVPLTQNQFDALVSFDINTGGIYRAKLTAAINNGDYSGKGFMGWLKPPEIRKRRIAEQRLFQTGDYDSNGTTIPVWGTDGNGKLKGVIKRIEGKDLLKRMGKIKGDSSVSSLIDIIINILRILKGVK